MPERVDHRMNLVIPVETDAGELYVFATPISRPVFERYFLVMARAFTMTFTIGGGVTSGPTIAMMTLRQAAQDMGVLDGPAGVERGLITEMRRLTNVVCPAEDGGWEPVPLMDAAADGRLSEDDLAEVEGAVAFFTLASALQQRRTLRTTIAGLESLWGAQGTPLSCTEWIASLRTSTETGTSSPQPTAGVNGSGRLVPRNADQEPTPGRTSSLAF